MARGRARRNTIRGGALIQRSRAVSPQQKAQFHAVDGAGRSRVIRDFFNLGPGDETAIVELLETRLGQNLQRGQ
jgi:hypothetical protein